MPETLSKTEAHRIVDNMPENSTWDDLVFEILVRQLLLHNIGSRRVNRRSTWQAIRGFHRLPE